MSHLRKEMRLHRHLAITRKRVTSRVTGARSRATTSRHKRRQRRSLHRVESRLLVPFRVLPNNFFCLLFVGLHLSN